MKHQKSFKEIKPTLFLVSTPIGNLDDMTYRAVKTLQDVDVIFCEDTRVSRYLLKHYDIHKPLFSYHDHNKQIAHKNILNYLNKGENVALISDAGTPVISDPGYFVSQEVINAGFHVVSIPGASAVLTALTASGLPPHPFIFYGFLDSKKMKREQQLSLLKELPYTLVFYESPRRVQKSIQSMYDILGERPLVLARELTKQYEEFIRGTTYSLLDIQELKGEMVLIVGGKQDSETVDISIAIECVDDLIKSGLSKRDAIKEISQKYGLSKNDLYMEYHKKTKE
jgi:16S rRNA (cytidine1402-2'-O)-methyltransferase